MVHDIKDAMLLNSAVGTIFNELEKLRKSSKENQEIFRKRWIWELIQNASDCCRDGEKIDIEIKFDGHSKLSFGHNGKGFKEENLWSMVTQISSKQSDDKTTGQFGTGFITTTLLSPKITIESFLENDNQSFDLYLDRTGQTRKEIRDSIRKNIDLIEQVLTTDDHFQERNTTSFIYNLEYSDNKEKSIEAINYGIESLISHIVYLLSFNREINSIKYNGNKFEVIQRSKISSLSNTTIVTVLEGDTGNEQKVLNLNFPEGTIAVPLLKKSDCTCFGEISKDVARLFYSFPLIGSENYPFPVVLNSNKFNVEIDRDGIFESDSVNVCIVEEAMSQYKRILSHFSNQPIRDTFNLCKFDRQQSSEYKKQLVSELDSIIMNEKLIKTNSKKLLPIKDSEGEIQIFVPNSRMEKYKESVWKLISRIPNINVPEYQYIDGWRSVINNDITLKSISDKELKNKTIQELADWLGEIDYIDWLNNYYQLLNDLLDKGFEEYYIPNYSGVFRQSNELILTENIMPELIEIWTTINKSRFKRIVLSEIIVPEKFKEIMIKKSNEKIAENISDHIYSLLSKETQENRTIETNVLFDKVLKLFVQKPDECEKLFPSIYKERTKLRSKQFSEQLNHFGDVISEKNISIEDLNAIVSNEKFLSEFLDFDGEITEEMKKQFQHISKQSYYSKKKVDELIERSTKNVFTKLTKNVNYVVPSTIEKWQEKKLSDTIFKATKNDKEIYIVIRPSDEDKIIFYEDKELNVLDTNNYELWTDNGENVKLVTLGDILKTTKISVIPLRNLY